ncbi:hypothetical protein BJS_09021 [Bradyrhizobium japonicum SEMIA 5079]|nr:hypothetical protein BJS_09021 [Bradyrhizobium japonicum SEMIA 5079]
MQAGLGQRRHRAKCERRDDDVRSRVEADGENCSGDHRGQHGDGEAFVGYQPSRAAEKRCTLVRGTHSPPTETASWR